MRGAGDADVGGAGDSCDACCAAWGPGGGMGAIGEPVIGQLTAAAKLAEAAGKGDGADEPEYTKLYTYKTCQCSRILHTYKMLPKSGKILTNSTEIC